MRPDSSQHSELVAEAGMVAASVLDAEGLWVESTDDVELHFMILTWCSLPSDSDGYKETEAAGAGR
ncbi:hypothetical protein [Streptomyces sp. NPDC057301]|uniref:hypothetical protein n=1 Tax=Streptomyces sp. NPDC057301 TaxID=3346093 RepID=UPI00363D3707